MVNEFVYCPRLFFLEWVQGEFAHSADTLEGAARHRRVDREEGSLPEAADLAADDRLAARGVLLSAPALGLIAKIDLLEGEQGRVRPVDFKKGAPGRDGPWEPDRVQLCVQGLILRENGYTCDDGVVYYATTRQRFVVQFDASLIERTLEAIRGIREVLANPVPPPPLVDSPKCPRCSLVGICLPDEVNLLRGVDIGEVRRLVPARDEAGPLYVVTQGATVGKAGERLVIRTPNEPKVFVRLIDVSHVAVFGNVQVNAQALRSLVTRGASVLHLTYGGWLLAVTAPPHPGNILLRMAQYQTATDSRKSLALARGFVWGKIRNQRTLLRRNHRGNPRRAVNELARLARRALQVDSMQALLGIEGTAARMYFSLFPGMLRSDLAFDFRERNRRPPRDPVNALLSFLYTLLLKDCVTAITAVGLDPYIGFFHQLHYGRPSLALDLAEEFRPLVADSVVLTLINNGMVDKGDFIQRGAACALKPLARRKVIEAYEARLETLVTHPVFGYSVSYRRILEIQARLLARVVAGELTAYRSFITR
ncbi:MAG: CRISPR-associated endonuclease Cas1 [Armatimonadota bacterium]|nr:CRISPR-associated endonuclease Cas1 [Armatimonadota bacterium]MDR7585446.1 CRISPR-associated endonuclease Cas1 [Armatimonadota bacterium]